MKTLFLASSANVVLADIVKHLPKNPTDYNLAFIPTASEVEEGDLSWLQDDKNKLIEVGFNVTEFSITGLNKKEIEEKLKNIDIIFVSGGNTFYLLDQAIKTGFDQILLEKSKQKLIYIGSSAGSMILGKRIDLASSIDDASKAPDLKSDGLGIVNFAINPHWGNSIFKEEYLSCAESLYTADANVLLLNDNQYLFVQDNESQIISI